MKKFGWMVLGFLAAVPSPMALMAQTGGASVDTIDAGLRERIDRIANGVLEQRGVPSASVAGGEGREAGLYGMLATARQHISIPMWRRSRRCGIRSGRFRSSLLRRRF